MDLVIVNHEFQKISVVDIYKSFIWTDRYDEYGDFEIYVTMSEETLNIFQNGYYIVTDISDRVMIIEDISLTTDVENGSFLIITGRSLESILDRRIIWNQTILYRNSTIENVIKTLLNDAIINPSISNRRIDNFIYKDSTDPAITNLRLAGDIQFTGDNLYEAIHEICNVFEIGFKITLNDESQFVFELYAGKDRSYMQGILPCVEFSPSFDNLITSDFKIVTTGYKNVTLVAGEGEGADRTTISINSDDYSGLNRRELYTDARDLSSNVDDGTLTPEQYQQVLTNRGIAKLAETQVESDFDAKVDYVQPYVYNEDFFMGDVVQFQNEFGVSSQVRITEFISSDSENGFEQYPTFKILEDRVYDPYTYILTDFLTGPNRKPSDVRITIDSSKITSTQSTNYYTESTIYNPVGIDYTPYNRMSITGYNSGATFGNPNLRFCFCTSESAQNTLMTEHTTDGRPYTDMPSNFYWSGQQGTSSTETFDISNIDGVRYLTLLNIFTKFTITKITLWAE